MEKERKLKKIKKDYTVNLYLGSLNQKLIVNLRILKKQSKKKRKRFGINKNAKKIKSLNPKKV